MIARTFFTSSSSKERGVSLLLLKMSNSSSRRGWCTYAAGLPAAAALKQWIDLPPFSISGSSNGMLCFCDGRVSLTETNGSSNSVYDPSTSDFS